MFKTCTEERFYEMLCILPPAYQDGSGFLVGEPFSHRICRHRKHIMPTYTAFLAIGESFYESTEPLTKAEYKAVSVLALSPKGLPN